MNRVVFVLEKGDVNVITDSISFTCLYCTKERGRSDSSMRYDGTRDAVVDGCVCKHFLLSLSLSLSGDRVPVVLVGNKSDLVEARQVTGEQVQEALGDPILSTCSYLETSAKENVNVARIFVELLRQAEELEAPPEQPRRRLSRRLSSLGNIHLTVGRRASLTPSTREEESRSCTIQ